MCGYEDASLRLKVADLERLAEAHRVRLQAEGHQLVPVRGNTRQLAKHFWAKEWMKNLSRCEAWGMNLAPGRTLLRHGCVLHLELRAGAIHALVAGEEVYEVLVRMTPLEESQQEALATACRGKIDSLVALLEGKVDESVLTCLCDPTAGLLPAPEDWRMDCSCPDWSEPCAHVAAAIYAVGIMLDSAPELLFRLRAISPDLLCRQAALAQEPIQYDGAALSSLFGIEIDLPDSP